MFHRLLPLVMLVLALAAASATAATITIANDQTPVMDRDKTIGTLSKGMVLNVEKTQGDWYCVRIKLASGQVALGYVHRSNVATPGATQPPAETNPLEVEARKEFEKRKAQADKLAAEGKVQEALDILDKFPSHFLATKVAKEVTRYSIEIEKRSRVAFGQVGKEAWDLVKAGKPDEARARIEAAKAKGAPANDPELQAAEAFLAIQKKAADEPNAPLANDPLAADVYAADTTYQTNLLSLTIGTNKPADQIAAANAGKFLEQYRWSPNLNIQMARLYVQTNQTNECLQAYEEARRLDQGRTIVTLDGYLEQARVLNRAKRHDEAIALLKKSLERKADDFIALAALGQVHLDAGSKPEAIAAWEKSLKLNPNQFDLARKLKEAKGEKVTDEQPKKLELPELVKQVEESCVVVAAGPSSGSGFVIRADGLISTNFHVIAPGGGKVQVRVKRAGQFVEINDVRIVAAVPPPFDMAILKINARQFPLKPLRMGSAKNVQNGEDVVVIGNPGMGGQILDYTITRGIVSNRDRAMPHGAHYIQTDAGVNPGNSGGPLFNLRAEVIGMVTLKSAVMEQTGFAVHIDHVAGLLPACFPQSE